MAMFGAVVFIIYAVMIIGCVGAFIITVVAIWKAMKAHESIADSLRELALNLKKEP